MTMHPNKHIRAAIKYAQAHGWELTLSNGHAYGHLWCPNACQCRQPVWSTPRVPEANAKDIRRAVDRCPRPTAEPAPQPEATEAGKPEEGKTPEGEES